MTNKALCLGINDYPIAGMDLKGCVNDAKSWASLLTKRYDFTRRDVTVLLDRDATRSRMLSELDTLLAGARTGDVLVFTNSSHGTYLADTAGDDTAGDATAGDATAGDEVDRYDEAMCPWDCKQHLLVDDDLRGRFADLPRGVRLTVISDSCHSGSVTRAVVAGLTPDDRRVRFMNPKKLRKPVIDDVRRRATPKRADAVSQADMKELLLSGCRSDQYSYDAKIGRTYHGAMTFHAIKAITDAGFTITYSQLARRLRTALEESRFDQEPQLEGRLGFKRRQVFT